MSGTPYNQAYLLENYVIKCNVIAHQNIIWLLFTKWAAHTHNLAFGKSPYEKDDILECQRKTSTSWRNTSMLEKDSLTWKYDVRPLFRLPQTYIFFSFHLNFSRYCVSYPLLFLSLRRGNGTRQPNAALCDAVHTLWLGVVSFVSYWKAKDSITSIFEASEFGETSSTWTWLCTRERHFNPLCSTIC